MRARERRADGRGVAGAARPLALSGLRWVRRDRRPGASALGRSRARPVPGAAGPFESIPRGYGLPAPGHRVMRRPTPQDIELVAARLGRRLVGPLLDRTTAAEGEAGAATDRGTSDP